MNKSLKIINHNNNNKQIKIGFSIGDPSGIGIEVILKTLMNKDIINAIIPIIFGSSKIINYQKNIIKKNKIFIHNILQEEDAESGKINVLNIYKKNTFSIKFGHPNEESAKIALESLNYSTKSLKNDKINILITAPINKSLINQLDCNFTGHTEYFEKKLNGTSIMLMVSDILNIGLVTNHLSIKKITSNITKEIIIKKCKILNQALIQDLKIFKPKIAVLGLNPHAGDNNMLGKEEEEIIKPAIHDLFFKYNILAFGPFPADSFFMTKHLKKFNGILSMYHDQALIPFKTLSLEEGINFTAGLSKIRISPNHGVAYNIAGKGIANENSLKYSILKGIEIYKNRIEWITINKNILNSLSKKIITEDENIE